MTANRSSRHHGKFFLRPEMAFVVAVLLAGCDQPKIVTYRAPKDRPAPVAAPQGDAAPSTAPRAQPQVTWTLPAGWKELGAGRMSIASFSVPAVVGKEAQVAITPLRALAGREADIVNMWRQQAGLAALTEDEAKAQLQPVEVAGEPGKMFEVTTKAEGTNVPVRVVTAMVHRPDASWFYKLSGDIEVVDAQKAAFVEFLKSVRIQEAPAELAGAPGAGSAPAESSGFKWKAPDGWQTVAPGQMQVAKFSMPAKGNAKADLSVSVFPSDTGGTISNIRRWRNQIGLGEATDAELTKLATPLDPANPRATLVDMTNNGKRLIGAIVPRGGQWFFYKLLGDADAVAPQKDAFIAFAKSQP